MNTMQLLSQLEIPNTNGVAVIELLHGDLSFLPPEHAVDIMVVSAYRAIMNLYRIRS